MFSCKTFIVKKKTNLSVGLGGDKRDRTADLLNAIQALSQLSYTPIFGSLFRQLLYYSMSFENVNRFFQNFLTPDESGVPQVFAARPLVQERFFLRSIDQAHSNAEPTTAVVTALEMAAVRPCSKIRSMDSL